MTGQITPRVSLAGIALTIGLLVFATWKTGELAEKVENLIGQKTTGAPRMQTLEEVVLTASGRTITVRTTRADGESVEDFIDRHSKTVDAVALL